MSWLQAMLLSSILASPVAPQIPVQQYVLDNGLTVVLSRDDRVPVVATEIRYLVGSANERKGRSGFAHLFEHLMFQGSKSYDREYFKPYEPIGGVVNGTTSQDRTNYFEQVPSNYLEMALWMESDRMENFVPALTQAKLDNQRSVVLNERRQRYEDQPYGMVWEYLAAMLHPEGHPYHHTPIGEPADIEAATLDDVRGFFTEYYVPANAVLTIVGDFEESRVRGMVEKYFGHIAAGKRAPRPISTLPPTSGIVHRTETDDVKLPRVYLAWNTPPLLAPGDAELDLWSSVLTRGKTSRLYKPLVYDQKVAKDVSAFQASEGLTSYYVVVATAAPGKTVEELHKALMQALNDSMATPPSKEELDGAINQYKKDFYSRVEDVVSRATLLSTYYHFTGKPDYLAQDLARYTDATPENVLAQAKKWLTLDRHLRIDILPAPAAPAAPAAAAEGPKK